MMKLIEKERERDRDTERLKGLMLELQKRTEIWELQVLKRE